MVQRIKKKINVYFNSVHVFSIYVLHDFSHLTGRRVHLLPIQRIISDLKLPAVNKIPRHREVLATGNMSDVG